MAICKMCHKQIPDGKDFCQECETKRLNQADESYLDSLLSSVSEKTPAVSRNTASFGVKKELVPDLFAVNEEIIFEDLDESTSEEASKEENQTEKEPEMDDMISDLLSVMDTQETSAPEAKPDMEEDDLSEIFAQAEAEHNSDKAFAEDTPVAPDDLFAVVNESEDILPTVDEAADDTDITATDEITDALDIESSDENEISDDIPVTDEIADGIAEDLADDITDDIADDITDETADEVTDEITDDITDITASDETTDTSEPEQENDSISSEENPELSDIELEEDIALADDLNVDSVSPFDAAQDTVSPFDAVSIDETVSPFDSTDIGDIDIETIDIGNEDNADAETPKDVFLGEEDLENSLLAADPDMDSLLDDIETGAFEKEVDKLNPNKGKKKKTKTKVPREKGLKGLFKSLFFNIQYTPEEIQATKDKEERQKEDEAIKAANKKRKAEESKEEKAQRKEEKKAENEEKKKQAAALKAQKKQEALEKAKKKKEEKLALQSIEVDEGRINRAGATILFVLFSIITVFIIIGTNIYSYNLSMKRAENDFNIRHYNEAYYDIYGLTIRNNEEDKKLSDKIMTVMYVNTQLNSYKYYMTSNNREKALNSLLKGLQRYDKYNELAGTLEIEDDFNYIRGCIIQELKTEFDISENEAYSMIDIDDSVDYSEYIYELLGTYEVSFSE